MGEVVVVVSVVVDGEVMTSVTVMLTIAEVTTPFFNNRTLSPESFFSDSISPRYNKLNPDSIRNSNRLLSLMSSLHKNQNERFLKVLSVVVVGLFLVAGSSFGLLW